MTGSKPRPPRLRPSRTGRAVPTVVPGVCHQCGAPAAHACRQCHRPVCDEHLVSLVDDLQPIFGRDACAECASYTTDDLARDEGQWAHRRDQDQRHRACALCEREFEQALPQCSRCGRAICSEHRVHYRRKFRFGAKGEGEEAWYWDHEVRCREHEVNSLVAKLKGWAQVPQ